MSKNPLLILVGMAGSGKSLVAEMIARRGWDIVYFGGVTLDELKRRGLDVNQDNERSVREELRRQHGLEAYAKLSHGRISEALSRGPTAIDGLYSWAEYKYVRANIDDEATVVCIYAPRAMRYDRLSRRAFRPLTPQQAQDRDYAEIENLDKGGPIAMADHMLLNDSTVENLQRQLDAVLEKLGRPMA